MQIYKYLPVVGCLMALIVLTADHAVGKLSVAVPRRLPVDSFPVRISQWQGGALQPVDPSVQEIIPTANIHERLYTNSTGQTVDCMLVTASDSEDLHDPAICFPSQGWALSNIRHPQIDGQSTTLMDADNGTDKMSVIYWTTAYYLPKPSSNFLIRDISVFRRHLVGSHEGNSLVVRLISPKIGRDDVLLSFANLLSAPLRSLTTERHE